MTAAGLCLILALSLPVIGAGAGAARARTESDNPVLEAGLRALREGDHAMAVTLLRSSAGSDSVLAPEAWLGLGIAYRQLGRPAAARQALQNSGPGLSPIVQAWVSCLIAEVHFTSGEPAAGDSILARLAERDLPPALGQRVRATRLERAVARRDTAGQRQLLADIIAARDPGAAAAACRLGQITAIADPAAAHGLYRQAFDLPGSDEVRGICAELLLAGADPTADELIVIGRVFFALADWDRARDAFALARERAGTPARAEEAAYRHGLTQLRARHYTAARDELRAVAREGSRYRTAAAYNAAVAAAAVSRREGPRDLIAFADSHPQSRWAPRALKQAGDRLLRSDPAEAEAVYTRLIEEYPRHWENAGVIFDLGRTALAADDTGGARHWFTTLGRGVFHPHEKSQGWYWAGRVAAGEGDSATAHDHFHRAAGEYPGTWYGALARLEQGGEVTATVRGPDFGRVQLQVPDWADPGLAAGIVLLRVGAGTAGEDQLLASLDALALPSARLSELWHLCLAGRAWGAARRLGDRLLRTGAAAAGSAFRDELLFPVYYYDMVAGIATRVGVDPWLVFALIRQESAFDAGARSYAGARGLMQLMPATAVEWAGRLRLGSIEEEDLYDPGLNIALGIPYLARLIDQFDGSVVKALAAYNGGPTNVRRWERGLADNRPETFVESIGFTETRTFVRTIMNNYHYYRFLWSEPAE